LAVDNGVPDYACDCPVGSDGAFCKHCVAAALARLHRAEALRVKSRHKRNFLKLVEQERKSLYV
jgi:uncharacterized Zn finger protein